MTHLLVELKRNILMPQFNVLPKYEMKSQVMTKIYNNDNKHVGWTIAVTQERDGRSATKSVDIKPENGVEFYKEKEGERMSAFEELVINTINEYNLIGQCNDELDS
jgi:hypothetical protein